VRSTDLEFSEILLLSLPPRHRRRFLRTVTNCCSSPLLSKDCSVVGRLSFPVPPHIYRTAPPVEAERLSFHVSPACLSWASVYARFPSISAALNPVLHSLGQSSAVGSSDIRSHSLPAPRSQVLRPSRLLLCSGLLLPALSSTSFSCCSSSPSRSAKNKRIWPLEKERARILHPSCLLGTLGTLSPSKFSPSWGF
jgi:hypothetical protein